MKHDVIYVPGILDDIANIQSSLVRHWRIYGVHPHTHVMPWLGEPDYIASKLRLYRKIESLHQPGNIVTLVGASAGASAVLNAYIELPDQVSGVVLLCPKINNADNIGTKLLSKNPSFFDSMIDLNHNLDKLTAEQKTKIVSFLSPRDRMIPYEDSTIPGVRERTLPAFRHNAAIVYAISLGSRQLVRELKRFAANA